MTCVEHEIQKLHHLNSIAKNNSIVFFGSDSFLKVPVEELAANFEIDTPVYNRSVSLLSIDDCEKALNECVYELNPSKIFLNIGETDLKENDFDCDSFISRYEWMLYTMHNRCNCRIYVVSIVSDSPKASYVNEKLKEISNNTGCEFIDITSAKNSEQFELKVFDIMRYYLRFRPISISQAFSIA